MAAVSPGHPLPGGAELPGIGGWAVVRLGWAEKARHPVGWKPLGNGGIGVPIAPAVWLGWLDHGPMHRQSQVPSQVGRVREATNDVPSPSPFLPL